LSASMAATSTGDTLLLFSCLQHRFQVRPPQD
jgi:hypothetical protein